MRHCCSRSIALNPDNTSMQKKQYERMVCSRIQKKERWMHLQFIRHLPCIFCQKAL